MFLSVPLEDLGLVFLADGPTLKRILLEEQVKRPVPAAAFRHVKELVIVPVLAKHALRPRCLAIEKLNNILRTILAHKRPEENNRVRAQVHLAIEAPFVVGVLEHLCQVGCQLRVDCQSTRGERHDRLLILILCCCFCSILCLELIFLLLPILFFFAAF